MKAERRQELKTNDLAQMMEELREFFRVWGTYVVGGLVLVILVASFFYSRARSAEQEVSDAWKKLSEVQAKSFMTPDGRLQPDDKIRSGFEELQKLADKQKDPDLLFASLNATGEFALLMSSKATGGVKPEYLDVAEKAFGELRTRLPDKPLAVGSSLNGLVNVEADRFLVDGDTGHKDQARKLLEQLRDDPRFANTPYQKAALERLNHLDSVFQKVTLAPAPEPTTQPAVSTGAPPAKPGTQTKVIPGGKITFKPVPRPGKRTEAATPQSKAPADDAAPAAKTPEPEGGEEKPPVPSESADPPSDSAGRE